jgi:hypothetical protein
MTLSMNPLGFQVGVAGCASPLVLVHRTINTCGPLLGTTKRVCHWRKLYLLSSLPSSACSQDLPPSLEKSRCRRLKQCRAQASRRLASACHWP